MRRTAVDDADARRAGTLLAATGRADTVDALLVAVAERRHAAVLTTDPGDVGVLADAARVTWRAM